MIPISSCASSVILNVYIPPSSKIGPVMINDDSAVFSHKPKSFFSPEISILFLLVTIKSGFTSKIKFPSFA